MGKYLILALVFVVGAAFLLGAASTGEMQPAQTNPYASFIWLAVILAFGVFAVLMVEHYIYGKMLHAVLGTGFLALAVMGIRGTDYSVYPALSQTEWIVFAVTLILGVVFSGGRPRKELFHPAKILTVLAGGIFVSAVAVMLSTFYPGYIAAVTTGTSAMVIRALCVVVFGISFFVYKWNAFNKGNIMLAWIGYAAIIAIVAQLALTISYGPALYGFAALLKVIVYALPLLGILAEHANLQYKLKDQNVELSYLVQAQEAVSSISTPDELNNRLVELTALAFSAEVVCLMPFDRERGLLVVAASTGMGDDTARKFAFRPSEGPAGASYSDGDIFLVRDVVDDPVLSRIFTEDDPIISAVFAPMVSRGRRLGALAVFFNDRISRLYRDQQRMLTMFANFAALAADNTKAQRKVVYTAVEASDQSRDLEVIWDIGQAVTEQLDLNTLVDTLAGKLGTALGAKACSVTVFEPDRGSMVIMGNRPLVRRKSIPEHVDECEKVSLAVAESGEPVIINDVPNSTNCKYPELANDKTGKHHLLSVPMSTPGFKGAINVFRQNTHPFSERDKSLLMRLAPMVAAGIRNADLYEREKRIAEELQKSFLPVLEKEMPGIEISSYYRAAYDDSLVGGDFYDIIDFGYGRYGIAIGDVAGKGVDAVVYTAMARYMIQAYSADYPDPLYVVPKLNSALNQYAPDGKFITMVYGLLDTYADKFTYVNAGHELPILFKKVGSKLESLKTTGPAVGAVTEADFKSDETIVQPGDTLIFYTDGATESRRDGNFLEEEGVKRLVIEQMRKGASDPAKAIFHEIDNYAGGHLRDDIAILTVKLKIPGEVI